MALSFPIEKEVSIEFRYGVRTFHFGLLIFTSEVTLLILMPISRKTPFGILEIPGIDYSIPKYTKVHSCVLCSGERRRKHSPALHLTIPYTLLSSEPL